MSSSIPFGELESLICSGATPVDFQKLFRSEVLFPESIQEREDFIHKIPSIYNALVQWVNKASEDKLSDLISVCKDIARKNEWPVVWSKTPLPATLFYAACIAILWSIPKFRAMFKESVTFAEFSSEYKDKISQLPHGEQVKLYHFRNMLQLAFLVVKAHRNKGLIIDLVPRLSEAHVYTLGGGIGPPTKRRVMLYEIEGHIPSKTTTPDELMTKLCAQPMDELHNSMMPNFPMSHSSSSAAGDHGGAADSRQQQAAPYFGNDMPPPLPRPTNAKGNKLSDSSSAGGVGGAYEDPEALMASAFEGEFLSDYGEEQMINHYNHYVIARPAQHPQPPQQPTEQSVSNGPESYSCTEGTTSGDSGDAAHRGTNDFRVDDGMFCDGGGGGMHSDINRVRTTSASRARTTSDEGDILGQVVEYATQRPSDGLTLRVLSIRNQSNQELCRHVGIFQEPLMDNDEEDGEFYTYDNSNFEGPMEPSGGAAKLTRLNSANADVTKGNSGASAGGPMVDVFGSVKNDTIRTTSGNTQLLRQSSNQSMLSASDALHLGSSVVDSAFPDLSAEVPQSVPARTTASFGSSGELVFGNNIEAAEHAAAETAGPELRADQTRGYSVDSTAAFENNYGRLTELAVNEQSKIQLQQQRQAAAGNGGRVVGNRSRNTSGSSSILGFFYEVDGNDENDEDPSMRSQQTRKHRTVSNESNLEEFLFAGNFDSFFGSSLETSGVDNGHPMSRNNSCTGPQLVGGSDCVGSNGENSCPMSRANSTGSKLQMHNSPSGSFGNGSGGGTVIRSGMKQSRKLCHCYSKENLETMQQIEATLSTSTSVLSMQIQQVSHSAGGRSRTASANRSRSSTGCGGNLPMSLPFGFYPSGSSSSIGQPRSRTSTGGGGSMPSSLPLGGSGSGNNSIGSDCKRQNSSGGIASCSEDDDTSCQDRTSVVSAAAYNRPSAGGENTSGDSAAPATKMISISEDEFLSLLVNDEREDSITAAGGSEGSALANEAGNIENIVNAPLSSTNSDGLFISGKPMKRARMGSRNNSSSGTAPGVLFHQQGATLVLPVRHGDFSVGWSGKPMDDEGSEDEQA